MVILDIVFVPDNRLRIQSKKVEKIDDEIKQLVDNMFETMYNNEGLGLAAVQVGVHKRIFVADVKTNSRYNCDDLIGEENSNRIIGGRFCVINPEIVYFSKDDTIAMSEGCLSIPGSTAEVTRPKHLTLNYIDEYGNERTIEAGGWLARCFQHEIDHLNGKLYIDYLSKLKRDVIVEKAKKMRRIL